MNTYDGLDRSRLVLDLCFPIACPPPCCPFFSLEPAPSHYPRHQISRRDLVGVALITWASFRRGSTGIGELKPKFTSMIREDQYQRGCTIERLGQSVGR